MPFKSRQLFYYFRQVHQEEWEKCRIPLSADHLKTSVNNPDALRGILLLAALHYSWNTGGLGEFESTYLTHKIECIRLVNSLLSNINGNLSTLRTHLKVIVILCFIETSTGNLKAAEAHLEGLVALLDAARSLSPLDDQTNDGDQILQRYISLCIREVIRLKTRIVCAGRTPEASEHARDPSQVMLRDMNQFSDRLFSLWVMPYFLVSSEDWRVEDIDARAFLSYGLRIFTDRLGGCRPSPWWSGEAGHLDMFRDGSGKSISLYVLWGLSDKGVRLCPTQSTSEAFHTSWLGVSIASAFYMYDLIGLAGTHMLQGRVRLWLLRMLQRDIEQTFEASLVTCLRSKELWLWKVVLGAFCVAADWRKVRASGSVESSIAGGEAAYAKLTTWFQRRIRIWSRVASVRSWEGAKDALAAVVWPNEAAGEPLAAMIWEQALEFACPYR